MNQSQKHSELKKWDEKYYLSVHLHDVQKHVTLLYGDRNQNTGYFSTWGTGLPRKDHEGTFWDDQIVLCLKRGVGYMGVYICEK